MAKKKGPDTRPITITFTIDPELKLNAQGERCMSTTIIARRDDVAQIRQIDVTNWKQDLPAEVDRLVQLLMGNQLVLPAFPNMGDARKVSSNDAVATAAASYIYRLLYRKPLQAFMTFVSLDAVRPIPITKENIELYVGGVN